MDDHGVDISLVMPHAIMDDPFAAHDAVASLCDSNKRFKGIASLTPHLDNEAYFTEIARCRSMGFVAIKLNPLQHVTAPTMPNADKVFRAGAEQGLPVIVHTGLGGSWAQPSHLIPVAKRFPDLPIVLAHSGFALYTDEARIAAGICPNLYLEPSWCPVTSVQAMVEELGTDRLMFGSDHPMNLPVELAKYRALGLSDDGLADVLGRTAERVFSIKG